jgi:hypothetical protein
LGYYFWLLLQHFGRYFFGTVLLALMRNAANLAMEAVPADQVLDLNVPNQTGKCLNTGGGENTVNYWN